MVQSKPSIGLSITLAALAGLLGLCLLIRGLQGGVSDSSKESKTPIAIAEAKKPLKTYTKQQKTKAFKVFANGVVNYLRPCDDLTKALERISSDYDVYSLGRQGEETCRGIYMGVRGVPRQEALKDYEPAIADALQLFFDGYQMRTISFKKLKEAAENPNNASKMDSFSQSLAESTAQINEGNIKLLAVKYEVEGYK